MARFRRFWLRLAACLRLNRAEEELARELTSHLALMEEEFQRQGMAQEMARLAARRAFGGVEQTRALHRDARSFRWLDDLRQDLPHALRSLARSPGFTSVALLTLALGIGANTAIFSVVNAVLLKPLAYAADSDRLVRLMINVPADLSPTRAARRVPVVLSSSELGDLKSRTRTLSHVGAAFLVLRNWRGHDPRLQAARMSMGIVDMLGARPVVGRAFTRADEAAGAEGVVLISYGMWLRNFGRDPRVLGQAMTLEGVPGPSPPQRYLIVGVMPETFRFPNSQVQLWLPFQAGTSPAQPSRGAMLARLADGVSRQAAEAEVTSLVREIRKSERDNAASLYELTGEHDEMVASVRSPLVMLSTAVGFVLLIACVNVANLLIGRTVARQRELAIRAALGAGRGRLARQFLTESLVLAVIGGIGAVVLALGGVQLLRVLAATLARIDLVNQVSFPRLDEVRVDATARAFAIAASIATGLLSGLPPLLYRSRNHPGEVLTEARGASHAGFGSGRRIGLRGVLVVAEVAMTVMLLVGGGLLIRSFLRLSGVDAGYDRRNILTFQIDLPAERYPAVWVKAFAETLVARLAEIPGVESAGYARQLPTVNLQDSFPLRITPEPPRQPPAILPPDTRLVSRDYLKVMGTRVVAGRGLDGDDGPGRPHVLLVNEALARRDFAGTSPIGRTVYLGPDSVPWEIVGIVADVRQFGRDREAGAQVFANFVQWPETSIDANGRVREFPLFPAGAYYAVRTSADPMALVPALRRLVGQLDEQSTLFYVTPMAQLVATTISRPRLYAVLFGTFSGVALVLAVIGIYGVMAYSVAQRTREIGIRMALGAQRAQVLSLVLRQGLVLTGLGLLIGIGGALATTRYLEGMLFALTPLDPATFAVVALIIGAVAVLAAYVPARRATKVDPLIALRCD